MANIAASDVSYSIGARDIQKMDNGRKIVNATISFGDGALLYPAGGIPLVKGKLGCPVVVKSFMVEDAGGSGYVFQYDKANEKLMIFQSGAAAAHSHNLLLKDAAVADGATTRVNAGTNLLGANTGADISVAGGGANGGVQSGGAVAAAALAEVTGVAIAAQVLKVTVIGY